MDICSHPRVRKDLIGKDELTCPMCGQTFANEQALEQARKETRQQEEGELVFQQINQHFARN
jgi:uncharacterized protein (DUF2225 family)